MSDMADTTGTEKEYRTYEHLEKELNSYADKLHGSGNLDACFLAMVLAGDLVLEGFSEGEPVYRLGRKPV